MNQKQKARCRKFIQQRWAENPPALVVYLLEYIDKVLQARGKNTKLWVCAFDRSVFLLKEMNTCGNTLALCALICEAGLSATPEEAERLLGTVTSFIEANPVVPTRYSKKELEDGFKQWVLTGTKEREGDLLRFGNPCVTLSV